MISHIHTTHKHIYTTHIYKHHNIFHPNGSEGYITNMNQTYIMYCIVHIYLGTMKYIDVYVLQYIHEYKKSIPHLSICLDLTLQGKKNQLTVVG